MGRCSIREHKQTEKTRVVHPRAWNSKWPQRHLARQLRSCMQKWPRSAETHLNSVVYNVSSRELCEYDDGWEVQRLANDASNWVWLIASWICTFQKGSGYKSYIDMAKHSNRGPQRSQSLSKCLVFPPGSRTCFSFQPMFFKSLI